MVSFENFVKSMTPSLLELKVTPSFCFAFKIPDDVNATNTYLVQNFIFIIKRTLFFHNLSLRLLRSLRKAHITIRPPKFPDLPTSLNDNAKSYTHSCWDRCKSSTSTDSLSLLSLEQLENRFS